MKVETARTIRTILLVLACIAFICGMIWSIGAAKDRASDTSNISISITNKDCYYNANESPYTNGCYHIDLTYSITNNTKVGWQYLNIVTYVYDRSGNSLGSIYSEFGVSYGQSDFHLGVGDTITKETGLEDNQPDEFFAALYQYDLSDLKFEYEIQTGTYYDD